MTDTPDLSLAALTMKHDLNFHLYGTELAAALARADAAEALTTEVTRLLAAEVIRLRQENDRLSQRVENLREALGDMLDDCEPDRPGAPRLSIREAARAALEDDA